MGTVDSALTEGRSSTAGGRKKVRGEGEAAAILSTQCYTIFVLLVFARARL